MAHLQHLPGAARSVAEWIKVGTKHICAIGHGPIQTGAQVLRVAFHPGRNQPWRTDYICKGCVHKAAAVLGSSYPGPPPPV